MSYNPPSGPPQGYGYGQGYEQYPPPPQHPSHQQAQPFNGYAPGPPSQPYAYSTPPQQPYVSDTKVTDNGERFKPKKKINDPVFLVLFILQLLGFGAVSGIAIAGWLREGGISSSGGIGSNASGAPGRGAATTNLALSLNTHTIYLLLIATGVGLVLSTIYLIAVRAFTRIIMHITLILTILLNIALCVYYWIIRYYAAAIVFTIIAVFSVLAYFGYRSRIPLAVLLLQVTMDVSKHHKSVYVVAFTALLVQAAFSVWFVFTAIATYAYWTPGNPSCSTGTSCSSATVTGLIVFELFSYIWTSQVIGNVALATMAGGPYGSWYYFGPEGQGMPKNPSLAAFGRASTLSLGSIAFGSLIVTVLELIRLLLQAVRNSAAQDGNAALALLACCAECCIGCIEGMVEYFNRYAYIQIALYGKPYIRAAKDTWNMFKDRGVDALINDSLVSMTLTWGGYLVGAFSALFGYLYLHFTNPAYNQDGAYTAPLILFSFLIGLQCSLTLSSAIDAGVSTIFVGLGEDPQVLAYRAPALFAMIRENYPQVVQGVHGV